MFAAVFFMEKRISDVDVPKPEIGPGELLINGSSAAFAE
jgi:NADPH:quinone reductase-like Zn-dependent oxidoreductase